MFFDIITLYPEYFHSFFHSGIMARNVRSGRISYRIINLRSFGAGGYRRCDDMPFSGGPGMLISFNVLKDCWSRYLKNKKPLVFLSPRGQKLDAALARRLAGYKYLCLFCGHFEGFDQRFVQKYIHEEVSAGDYVLSGGETASLTVMESIARMLDSFCGNPQSLHEESFENSLLEY
ncbi:MAG: hypothetical protein A2096_05310, partial [Spirochaetes bacterium GWF1_41_5]